MDLLVPLNAIEEVLAMTPNRVGFTRPSSEMSFSVRLALKNSSSGLALRFSKGSTANITRADVSDDSEEMRQPRYAPTPRSVTRPAAIHRVQPGNLSTTIERFSPSAEL